MATYSVFLYLLLAYPSSCAFSFNRCPTDMDVEFDPINDDIIPQIGRRSWQTLQDSAAKLVFGVSAKETTRDACAGDQVPAREGHISCRVTKGADLLRLFPGAFQHIVFTIYIFGKERTRWVQPMH